MIKSAFLQLFSQRASEVSGKTEEDYCTGKCQVEAIKRNTERNTTPYTLPHHDVSTHDRRDQGWHFYDLTGFKY